MQPGQCWEWQGTTNGSGYGTIGLGSRAQGKGYAHRIVFERAFGPIPEGQHVCHRCDNPKCVNPEHLFLGTRSDNMRDCWNKGRNRLQREGVVRPMTLKQIAPERDERLFVVGQ